MSSFLLLLSLRLHFHKCTSFLMTGACIYFWVELFCASFNFHTLQVRTMGCHYLMINEFCTLPSHCLFRFCGFFFNVILYFEKSVCSGETVVQRGWQSWHTNAKPLFFVPNQAKYLVDETVVWNPGEIYNVRKAS